MACLLSFGISPWPWELLRRACLAARVAYSSLFLLGDVKKKKKNKKKKKKKKKKNENKNKKNKTPKKTLAQ